MTIRNLEFAVRPTSVAVFGASARAGSVGRVVMDNIVNGGFEGDDLAGQSPPPGSRGPPCYRNAADLPGVPDLGVIVTPPETVPGIIRDLAEKGTRAAVVITAGLTRENGLRQAMLDAAKPNLFRIIGPNTVGLMIPPLGLNAGFAHMAARPGNIALLSQSGAIATSLIDWAADNDVGFSQIVSLGDMADVDVGDWLDMLAGDAKTPAIVMYLETIPNPRKFMSAARAAARIKPVIAVKSGRHEAAAKAAATHTGALSGADRVVDAALATGRHPACQRAGRAVRCRGNHRAIRAARSGAGRHRHQWRRSRCAGGRPAVDCTGELAQFSRRHDRTAERRFAADLVARQPGRHHRRRVARALCRGDRGRRCRRRRRRRPGA